MTPTQADRHAAARAIEGGEPTYPATREWIANGGEHPYQRMAMAMAEVRREGFVAGFKDAHVAEGGAG